VVNSATGETIYTPPPAHDVPIMMAELVDFVSMVEIGLLITEGAINQLVYRMKKTR